MNQELVRQYIKQMKVTIQTGRLATTPPTWKETNQVVGHSKLYYIVDGEGVIKIDQELLYPKKGDLVYIPEGATISYESVKGNPIRKYWCNVLLRLGASAISDYMSIPHIVHVGEDLWLQEKFEMMLHYHVSEDAFAPMMAHSLFMEIFYYYIKRFDEEAFVIKVNESRSNLNDLLKYMDQHLHHKISLKELAEVINVHPNYMIHLFKSQFGMSPIDYLNMLRINKAKSLLELEVLSIREISVECGFSNQYYFSQVFKKYVGLSPTGFRQSANHENL